VPEAVLYGALVVLSVVLMNGTPLLLAASTAVTGVRLNQSEQEELMQEKPQQTIVGDGDGVADSSWCVGVVVKQLL